MTKIEARFIFGLAVACGVLLSFCNPSILSDENGFLSDFVNHQFLNFMGIIVTITLASTANIHINLVRMEKENEGLDLDKTRAAVRRSALSLVWILLLSVVVVVLAKPLLPPLETYQALMNTFALAIILWGVLVLYDITKLAFKLED